ncbi:alpha-L-fucosidase [Salinarchaeum laminariae]|uniref:alpha-L-fucosidase n=1 Tax=Salinarchaeum laminariae TaxID=869888 RepID=UPI0020BDC20D|nr:alpha-L-fucosidase [Salinarchaeum laminariae]
MTRPEPSPRVAAFEQQAYGMFLHWGVYSQLGRGEWVLHQDDDITHDEYEELTETFTAEAFDGREIARVADEAGMNYAVLTARHHDGFSLYDTQGLTDYDAPNSAADRDLVRDFVEGCRAEGISPLLYHTTLDWHHDTLECSTEEFDEYVDFLHDSLEVVLTEYDIDGLWFDGDWSRDDVDWRLDERYSLIREHQPDALIINNTGIGNEGEVSHPEIDCVTFEQSEPDPMDRDGMDKYVAAEMCQTMNNHWGNGECDFNYKSPADIIETLATCRGRGANYLLNVGPTAEGSIPEYETAALKRAGEWVAMHGDVLYEGQPIDCETPGRDAVLETDDDLYYLAFDLSVSGNEDVTVSGGGTGPRAVKGLGRDVGGGRWLDSGEELQVCSSEDGEITTIDCTGYPYGTDTVVRIAELDA